MLCGFRAEETATLLRLPEELWLYTFGLLKHDQQQIHAAVKMAAVPCVVLLLLVAAALALAVALAPLRDRGARYQECAGFL